MQRLGWTVGLVFAVIVVVVGGARAMEWRSGVEPAWSEPARPLAPALTGRYTDSRAFNITQLHGAPAVLVFVSDTECGLCARRLDLLVAHLPAYEQLGARVVVITPEPGAQPARGPRADLLIVMTSRTVFEAWGVWPSASRVPRPAEFVLDERGAIVFEFRGRNGAAVAGDVELLAVLRANAEPLAPGR